MECALEMLHSMLGSIGVSIGCPHMAYDVAIFRIEVLEGGNPKGFAIVWHHISVEGTLFHGEGVLA